ncbi:hypothetical protein SDC9_40149 [bioreactor metagenome]|uniref:Glycosyltransferase subfamily 4-like N-terminal domain-containing protein n=1 Tax=bioreactor metagenome TaxID=1076179 RepID=A0A644VRI3_9ZZZZ|nr:glycosyltransferase [Lentimicrobium sp.]MEA5111758.1 glycosyltransferase [Lentimicrobium sp.]
MGKLNILISHTSVFKKAGWGRIFPLAVGLVKNGNQVTILTTNPKFSLFTKRVTVNGVNIIIFPELIPARVSRMGFGFLSLFLKVLHVLFNRYDVVHSDNGHRPLAGIPCRVHKRRFGSVYVAEWYDWYGKGGEYDNKSKIFKLLLGWYELKYEIFDKKIADGVVVLSESLRARAELLKPNDRVIKIHGGADVSAIPFLHDNSHLKIKYNIDEDALTFGYINANNNNIAELLPLVNALIKLNNTYKIKILIFGDSKNLISQLNTNVLENLIVFGWIDFAKDFEKLQIVDVFFLFKENTLGNIAGWPNCIGDYLACGRPVLLNPVGEVIDFVKEYPDSFIVCSVDADDICSKIMYISNSITLLRNKGKDIRKLAEDIVSWERKSKDLLDFYTYLLEIKKL